MKFTKLLTLSFSAFCMTAFGGTITFKNNTAVGAADLGAVQVRLTVQDDALVPSTDGTPYTLSQLDPKTLSPAAVNAILREVSSLYQERGVLATRAVVTKESYQRSRSGGDLEVRIIEGRISEVRVVPTEGGQPLTQDKIDRIASAAPLNAGDLVDGPRLDATLGQANRFSRQIVRPVLVPDEGGAILEYRVKQLKEWEFRYTFDNYGTERTGETRHSVDYNQWNVFTTDDHLALTGLISTEGDAGLLRADYTMPLDNISSQRLKFSIYGSNYNAQDVGLGSTGVEFEGSSYGFLGSYERTLMNRNGAYLDGSVGLHFLSAMQDQSSVGVPSATTQYLLPYIGLRYAKSGIDTSWVVGAKIEGNLSGIAGTDSGVDLALQGRLNASDDFILGHIYGGYRTYLDDLFGGANRRAHEVSVYGAASASLGGDRVPPSFLNIVGGPYSVRGYPIGILSGDNSIYVKSDYKLHLNRMGWGLGGEPGTTSSRFLGDMPDLDVALGAFMDVGSVSNEDIINAYEIDDTVWSMGLGVSADYQDRYALSLEYAWALSDLATPNEVIDSGDGQFYIKATAKW